MNALLRGLILAAFLTFALSWASALQTTNAPQPSQPAASKPAPAQGSTPDSAFAPGSANSNQELTHAANEAAGRTPQESAVGAKQTGEPEDEEAAFRYSPAVRGIARMTGTSQETAYWICVVINFAVIAVLIVLGLKSNLPAMFRGRTQEIQKEMSEARRASEEAKSKLQEIEARLAKMNVEIREMQAKAESDGRAEEERILASIEEEKKKILQSAEQEVEQATSAARRDLQKYAVALAVDMAEKGIRVDANEDKALVDDFTAQLASEARRNGAG